MAETGLGVGITPISEELYECFGDTLVLRSLKERLEVVDVRVNTSIGHETKEMQPAVSVLRPLEGLEDVLLLGDLAVPDGLVDADDVLPDNATSTAVQVTIGENKNTSSGSHATMRDLWPWEAEVPSSPDFRVSHETIVETDIETVCLEQAVGVVLVAGEGIHVCGVCRLDGVALLARLIRDSPPVVDDKADLCFCFAHDGELYERTVRGKGIGDTLRKGEVEKGSQPGL